MSNGQRHLHLWVCHLEFDTFLLTIDVRFASSNSRLGQRTDGLWRILQLDDFILVDFPGHEEEGEACVASDNAVWI